jgi:integrase
MLGEVMRYAVAGQAIPSDPSRDLRGALIPHTVRNLPSILEPRRVGQVVRDIRRYRGTPTVRAALQFAILTFQRTHMLREMKWVDVDFDACIWRIPSAGIKRRAVEKLNGTAHLVPLSRQAIELLRTQRLLSGAREWVFPATHNRSGFSEATINNALVSMGYKNQLTGHGFRAMARTLMVELDATLGEVLEAQLAHKKSGPLGAAYDRSQYLELRRSVMQRWADYLDRLAADDCGPAM